MNYQELAKKYGTPFYIFDIEKLKKRIKYLKDYLGFDIDLVYAVKANTFLIPYIYQDVEKLELCSFGEYEIAKTSKVPASKMVISGVYKNEREIRQMLEEDVPDKFTIESLNQFYLLDKLSLEYQKKLNVILRYTSGSQFGMSKSDIKEILETKSTNLKIKGIQYFSKTQRHSIPILEKELIKINEFMEELEKEFNIVLEEFEYGPGFPVYYFLNDEFLEDEFLTEFNRILKNIKNKKVSIELGRSIAASCGEYITKVVDIKTNKTGNYAIVDGGINHLVYYGGNMGIRVPQHEIIPSRRGDNSYIICGALCTINDILVKELKVSKFEVGDLLIFKNTGAYAPFEGISLFLSRELPKAIIKNKNELHVVRESFKTSKLNSPEVKGEC